MSRDRDGWQQLTYGKWLRTYRKPCIAVFAILPMSRSEVTAVRNVIFYQHDFVFAAMPRDIWQEHYAEPVSRLLARRG